MGRCYTFEDNNGEILFLAELKDPKVGNKIGIDTDGLHYTVYELKDIKGDVIHVEKIRQVGMQVVSEGIFS